MLKIHKQSHKNNCVPCWRESLSYRVKTYHYCFPVMGCHISRIVLLFLRSLRSHWCWAGKKGIGQIQLHGSSACGGGTLPPPSPAGEMRRVTGQGLQAAGAHGLNTTRRGQEHSAHRTGLQGTPSQPGEEGDEGGGRWV